MSNLDDRLNEILATGVVANGTEIDDEMLLQPTITEIPTSQYPIVSSKDIPEPSTDYDDDYLLVRDTLRGVLDRSKGILDVAILSAVNTENPRYLDAVTGLIGAIKGVSKDLLDMHGKGKKESKQHQVVNISNTTNNYTTEEKKKVIEIIDSLPDI